MIHKYNIAELSLVDRPVKGPQSGFGSIVKKHPNGHDYLFRDTSNGVAYGNGAKLNAGQELDKQEYLSSTQGGLRQLRPFAQQGVRCISGLMGEVYK